MAQSSFVPSIPDIGSAFGEFPAVAVGAVPGLLSFWNPNVLGNLFQDVAKTVPVAANGDPVGAVASAGLIDAVATADDGTRPTYAATGINGKPALQFTAASSQKLTANAIGPELSGEDHPSTIIAVVQPDNLTANNTVCSLGNSGTTQQFDIWRTLATTGRVSKSRRGDSGNSVLVDTASNPSYGTVKAGLPVVVCVTFDGTSATIWLMGVPIVTGAQNVVAATFDLFTIGALRTTSVSFPFNGKIGPIAVFDNAIAGNHVIGLTRTFRDLYQI